MLAGTPKTHCIKLSLAFAYKKSHLLPQNSNCFCSMMVSNSFPKLLVLAVIVAVLISHNLDAASAASGGRMGGSSFSSETESSPSSPRHDYHHHHYGYDSRPRFSGNANQGNGSMSAGAGYLILTIFLGTASYLAYVNIAEGGTSILQIQVGLSAKARSLQRELTEIASTTDTSTANGWHLILEETTSSLLRHPDYYIYGHSLVTRCRNIEGAEQHFKRLSKEERLKFDVESLVNINNFKRKRDTVPKADEVNKDCIMVTVLVAVQGAHNLPTITTTNDVKKALQSLGEICSSKIKGVEVLWTPQDENDSLSVEAVLENYPQLRRI